MNNKQQRNRIIPSKVSDKTKRFMKELLDVLEETGFDSGLDKTAIRVLSYTYDNYIKATETLEQSDIVIYKMTTSGRQLIAHPAVKIQLDAQIQLTKLLIEFGLTPKSRKDVNSARKGEDATDLELFLSSAKNN